MKPHVIVTLIIVVVLLAVGGLGYGGYSLYTTMKKEFAAVEGESRSWVKEYNAGNFSGLYKMADAQLTKTISEPDFIAKMGKLKEQFGDVLLGAQVGCNIKTYNGDTTAVTQFDATDARGKRKVIFTFHLASGWKVLGFNINQEL